MGLEYCFYSWIDQVILKNESEQEDIKRMKIVLKLKREYSLIKKKELCFKMVQNNPIFLQSRYNYV